MVYKLFKLLPLDLRSVAVPEDEIRIPVFADDPAELVLADPEVCREPCNTSPVYMTLSSNKYP